MGERTDISWTDKTWNPWMGCFKVSPGCKQCYMYRDQRRYGNDPTEVRRSKTTFRDPLRWTDAAKVFTCSWSDFFLEEADQWRPEAWDIIQQTPHLTYQVLTKRPERVRPCLPADWGSGYANVWLGVSVEHDGYRGRAEHLVALPARTRFVSYEPALGPLTALPDGIDWLIIGGESGPEHRPMDLRWLAGAVWVARRTGAAVWVKQDSGAQPGQQGRIPEELWIQEWPT